MNSEYKTLRVHPVSREIGAEISGVDIASGINDEQFSELKQAYSDYGVIFFRDQPASRIGSSKHGWHLYTSL